MTADEARAAFSAAYDGELTAEQRVAFDAALAADAALRAEFEELSALLRETSALAQDEAAPRPDLLAGVQHKLRARSRGRYYRDRFAEKSGTGALLPIVMGIVMLVVLGVAWLALQYTVVEPGAPARPPPTAPG